MRSHTTIRDGKVAMSMWLAFDATGNARMTRGQPSLSPGERAMALTVVVPLALFSLPTLSATLTVDAPAAGVTPAIDVHAASDALRTALGCDVSITIRDTDA